MPRNTQHVIESLLGDLLRRPDGPPPRTKVALVSTPRCGSKYFCSALAGTGRFGVPMEWMGPEWIEGHRVLTGAAKADVGHYLRFIRARTTTPNGVFALNFHVSQYVHWRRRGVDLLRLGFDRVYCLARRDRLAQALSLAQARRSNVWSSLQWSPEADQGRAPPPAEVRDADVFRALHDLAVMDEQFESSLARHCSATFWYEDFTANDSALRRVMQDSGVAHDDIARFETPLRRQRDDRSPARIRSLLDGLQRR